MKRLIKFITPLFALTIALAGCAAGARVGPVQGGTSINN